MIKLRRRRCPSVLRLARFALPPRQGPARLLDSFLLQLALLFQSLVSLLFETLLKQLAGQAFAAGTGDAAHDLTCNGSFALSNLGKKIHRSIAL